MNQQYDVFISYSRKDYVDEQKNVIPDNEVSKIKDALSEVGITYWFDEEGIYSGQNFVEKIVTNIEKSKIFLFLSTANANKSPWTCKEIASADELNKHIIPVRIDSTPYNKKVLFRIADLDYIEYYANPRKGMVDLITSIKAYLEEIANAEKIKKEKERQREEELKKQQEQNEKRKLEEQQRLVSEIRLSCATLNNEEAKLELDRENLILKAKRISDDEQRTTLLDLINNGGAIHKKYQEKYSEFAQEIEKLKSTDIESLQSEIKNKDKRIAQLELSLKEWQKKAEEKPENKKLKHSRLLYVIYGISFFIVLVCAISYRIKNNELESQYDWIYAELRESKETMSLLSSHTPLFITDIEVKNKGEEWGDKIYSKKSTYIMPRVKYIGIKEGTYKLETKIFDNAGNLERNAEISPTGYTNSTVITVRRDENYADLIGWGNEQSGCWSAGKYRIEIWYDGKKISEKSFRVY